MSTASDASSGARRSPAESQAREQNRGRLIDRGIDPDRVIGHSEVRGPLDVAAFYGILGVVSATEKAGQSPTYALARLALSAGLTSELADTLFLAYNQQSAEEAGHGDKVFANAYFAMGGVAPDSGRSAVGDPNGVASRLTPGDDPDANAWLLASVAAVVGGIETVALQRVFPLISSCCDGWGHAIGRDLALQIRDVVRPEESRHVLLWRYVFHQLIVPRGATAIDAYLQASNVGRAQLNAAPLERDALERMLGSAAPTPRQLLGKDRVLHD